ncbi:MAG: hypothetical protein AB8B66_05545 [Rickettsiaceae bacterium]
MLVIWRIGRRNGLQIQNYDMATLLFNAGANIKSINAANMSVVDIYDKSLFHTHIQEMLPSAIEVVDVLNIIGDYFATDDASLFLGSME